MVARSSRLSPVPTRLWLSPVSALPTNGIWMAGGRSLPVLSVATDGWRYPLSCLPQCVGNTLAGRWLLDGRTIA